MAKIIETLVDRKGNVIPNTSVVAKEVDNPFGEIATATSDKFGNYELSVTAAATVFDIWVGEITSILSSNYIGRRVSSGEAVASFSLCDDTSWKVEHYGSSEALSCGIHKDTTHDSILLRSSGYLKTTSTSLEIRIGSDTDKFLIQDIGDTFFITPKVSGGTNVNIGLADGPSGSGDQTKFYFGSAKTKYIDNLGSFVLNGGSFDQHINFNASAAFDSLASFSNAAGTYPRLSTYIAPTSDTFLAPKKYVDDQITANLPPAMDKIIEGNTSVEIIDTGTGQVITTHDGVIYGISQGGKFGFGGNFTIDEIIHVKNAVDPKIKVERTGVSTTLFSSNSVGTSSATDFYIKVNNNYAAVFNNSTAYMGLNTYTATERLHVNGNVRTQGYIEIDSSGEPDDPVSNRARMYVKIGSQGNYGLCVKILKNYRIEEILLTSPEGKCSVCGVEGSLRDPYFDIANNKMIITFLCGHKYSIDMNFTPIGDK